MNATRFLAILSLVCAVVALAADGLSVSSVGPLSAFVGPILVILSAPLGALAGVIGLLRANDRKWVSLLGFSGCVISGILFAIQVSRALSSPNFLRGMVG